MASDKDEGIIWTLQKAEGSEVARANADRVRATVNEAEASMRAVLDDDAAAHGEAQTKLADAKEAQDSAEAELKKSKWQQVGVIIEN